VVDEVFYVPFAITANVSLIRIRGSFELRRYGFVLVGYTVWIRAGEYASYNHWCLGIEFPDKLSVNDIVDGCLGRDQGHEIRLPGREFNTFKL